MVKGAVFHPFQANSSNGTEVHKIVKQEFGQQCYQLCCVRIHQSNEGTCGRRVKESNDTEPLNNSNKT